MTELLSLIRPAEVAEPTGAIVLLHGRGADEHDLYPFFDMLDPQRTAVGVTIAGPLHLPPGGKHWYAVHRIGFPDPSTFTPTFAALNTLVAALPERIGVPWERTVIGGFSQGAVMAYALALGSGRPSPAGILAMSGFIPTVPGLDLDLDSRTGLPVFIAHGTNDPVIGVGFGRDARNHLTAAGAAVTYRESQMAHSIDPRVLPEIAEWVGERLAPTG